MSLCNKTGERETISVKTSIVIKRRLQSHFCHRGCDERNQFMRGVSSEGGHPGVAGVRIASDTPVIVIYYGGARAWLTWLRQKLQLVDNDVARWAFSIGARRTQAAIGLSQLDTARWEGSLRADRHVWRGRGRRRGRRQQRRRRRRRWQAHVHAICRCTTHHY